VVNCSGESTAAFDAPSAEINIDGSVFCNGLSVNFIDQSENALFYLWDFGVPGINSDISTAQNPVYVYPDTGRYVATLIVNPGYSCADTTFLQVGVYAELIADINDLDGQCIINNSFSFGAEGDFDADANFFWEFPGPSSYLSSDQMNPPSVSYSEAGNFEAYLSITTTHCLAFDTIEVIVYPELQIDLNISDADACVPATIAFDNLSPDSPGALYTWSFGDGSSSSEYAPSHYYEEPGIYDIQLSVEHVIGCVGTVTELFPQYIRIRPRPDAGIDAEPVEVDILNPAVLLYDISSGQISSWINPGTGEEFFESSIEFLYSDTGNYTAMVVALNEEGCYDTASVLIRVNPVFNVYIPNAFSPNGDGINETFIAIGEGFKKFSMAIFDRWGDEIFVSNSEEIPWDGRANRGARIAQSGVYNYKFWIVDVFNTEHIFTGKVLLIR
jgi:gliding motility-associated-like protein